MSATKNSRSAQDRSMIQSLLKDATNTPAPVQKTIVEKVKEPKEEQRQLNFWVPKEFKRDLDQWVAREDTTIKDFMQAAAIEYWNKRGYDHKAKS